MMKSILMTILKGVTVLLMVSSCATVPSEPLGSGEVRLLGIHVHEEKNLRTNIPFLVTIKFEADGKPEIDKACFYWSGNGPD